MSSFEELIVMKKKIEDLEIELESKSFSEQEEIIIRQQILEYNKLLIILCNVSSSAGKNCQDHWIYDVVII